VGNTVLKTKAYLAAQRELDKYIEKNAGTTLGALKKPRGSLINLKQLAKKTGNVTLDK